LKWKCFPSLSSAAKIKTKNILLPAFARSVIVPLSPVTKHTPQQHKQHLACEVLEHFSKPALASVGWFLLCHSFHQWLSNPLRSFPSSFKEEFYGTPVSTNSIPMSKRDSPSFSFMYDSHLQARLVPSLCPTDMTRFRGQMLTFSPLDQNCLQEAVTSLCCSQRMCRERRPLSEMLSPPALLGWMRAGCLSLEPFVCSSVLVSCQVRASTALLDVISWDVLLVNSCPQRFKSLRCVSNLLVLVG